MLRGSRPCCAVANARYSCGRRESPNLFRKVIGARINIFRLSEFSNDRGGAGALPEHCGAHGSDVTIAAL